MTIVSPHENAFHDERDDEIIYMIIFPIAFISGLTLLLKALSSAPEIVATVDAGKCEIARK